MAILYSVGKSLVDFEELNERIAIGDFNTFQEKAQQEQESFLVPAKNKEEKPQEVSFSPVGIGKPLSVEILTVYTGDAPRKLFGGKPDLLVVSGIKSVQTFDAAPRAINQIEENIKDKQYIKPGAFSNGSPIVYYTPSLEASTTFLSFELVVDTLKRDTISAVENLFESASGLPVFAPASEYLIAGSIIVSIVSDLLDAFESPAFLSGTLDLRFLTSGIPIFRSGHYVIYNRSDLHDFREFKIGNLDDGFGNIMTALVHKGTGKEYKGDAPYIILNIDGRIRPDLEGFVPKLASAAILDQFYGKDKGQQVVQALETAVVLYNDMSFRKKGERMVDRLKEYPPTSEEYLLALSLFEAYNANIQNDLLRIELDENGNIKKC